MKLKVAQRRNSVCNPGVVNFFDHLFTLRTPHKSDFWTIPHYNIHYFLPISHFPQTPWHNLSPFSRSLTTSKISSLAAFRDHLTALTSDAYCGVQAKAVGLHPPPPSPLFGFLEQKWPARVNSAAKHHARHQGSKSIFSNTRQSRSKRELLVANMAVKLKFQSPNWQMQINALLVCRWSGFCLIDRLV